MSERSVATAVACSNIALIKYWGKSARGQNLTAVPSLSMTLSALRTTTRVSFEPNLEVDRVQIGAEQVSGRPYERVVRLLDEVRALDAAYGATQVLYGVDFTLAPGQITAILGANGAGKTTTLRALCQTLRTSGSILFDGQQLVGRATESVVRLGVAHVPDGRGTFGALTVEENLLLGAYRKAARADRARNLAFVYATFPVLAERRRQLAGTMSGGQQQMLAIGRALMSSPRLLLIDEPSVGLSPLLVSQVITQIGELKRTAGLTVLMAEQNLAQAVRIADRGYVIVHGQIAFEGRSADELRSNDLVRELYLGEESAGGTGGAPQS